MARTIELITRRAGSRSKPPRRGSDGPLTLALSPSEGERDKPWQRSGGRRFSAWAWFGLVGLASVVLSGCTHFATVKKVGNIGSNEGIAYARVKIVKDGEDFSRYSNLIVDAEGHNSYVGAYQHPGIKDGVYCVCLPVGQYHFFHIRACKGAFRSEYGYDFKTNQVTFAVPEPNRAYYLGDITIDWRPKSSNRQLEAAIVGGIIGAALMP